MSVHVLMFAREVGVIIGPPSYALRDYISGQRPLVERFCSLCSDSEDDDNGYQFRLRR